MTRVETEPRRASFQQVMSLQNFHILLTFVREIERWGMDSKGAILEVYIYIYSRPVFLGVPAPL